MVPSPDWTIWVLYEDDLNHLGLLFIPQAGVMLVHMYRQLLPDNSQEIGQQKWQLVVL